MRHIWPVFSAAIVAASSSFVTRAEATPFKVTPYGFVKAEWLGATAGVDSFSQPNFSAYTAAGNPALSVAPDASQSSFQVAQSRFGLLAKSEDGKVEGKIELDFIDFAKASPTTASLPRLRRAVVDYHPVDNVTLRFGQDWDMVSPLGPFGYNFVGHYFQAGNIGFMRTQATVLIKSESFEHGISLALPAANANSANQSIELGLWPAIELREVCSLSERTSVGISAIGAALRQGASTTRYFAGGATIFAATKFESGAELKAEAYAGRDLFNLGLLGISSGDGSRNPGEAGGFVSGRISVSERNGIFGGVGTARILNEDAVVASYSTTGAGVSSLNGRGPGIIYNNTIRAGWEFKATEGLTFFSELAWLNTRYQLSAADAARYDSTRNAMVLDIGTQMVF